MAVKRKTPKLVKYYSEAFRRHVVNEIERGEIGASEAQRRYHIGHHKTISRWRRRYGTLGEVKVVMILMKDESNRIREL